MRVSGRIHRAEKIDSSGAVAQLGERELCKLDVTSSILVSSTDDGKGR